MSSQPQHQYGFGSFYLDGDQHLLTLEGRAIDLPPKGFELLCLLVSSRGQLLEKDHLMQALWPNVFVEEANLSNLISLLRKALGDSPGSAKYIRTVPKLGYRFIAPVNSANTTSPSAAASPRKRAIRILAFPFRCSAAFSELEHLAFSLPDAISTALAQLNVFTVRAIQSATRFDPLHWDPKAVAAEANVDVIFCGTLGGADREIHATTQLIEAPSGTVLWSKSWNFNSSELFRFQQAVVQLIVDSLVRDGSVAIHMDTPANAETYELYLRANQLMLIRTRENFTLARDLLATCTVKDPNYAPAWAQLARCWRLIDKVGFEGSNGTQSAIVAIEHAFALNPDLSIAHNVYTPIQSDMGQAESAMIRLLHRASAHDNDPEVFSALVQACRYCGQLDASLAAHRRTLALDPNARTSVAHTYFAMCDFEKALLWYDKPGLYLDALALTSLGRLQEASTLLWTRKDKFPMMSRHMYSLDAYVGGQPAKAIAALTTPEASDPLDPEGKFYLARQAARLGCIDLANDFLLQSVEEGFWSTVSMSRDPWLEPLRATATYALTFELAKTREEKSRAAFQDAGGDRILLGSLGSR